MRAFKRSLTVFVFLLLETVVLTGTEVLLMTFGALIMFRSASIFGDVLGDMVFDEQVGIASSDSRPVSEELRTRLINLGVTGGTCSNSSVFRAVLSFSASWLRCRMASALLASNSNLGLSL